MTDLGSVPAEHECEHATSHTLPLSVNMAKIGGKDQCKHWV